MINMQSTATISIVSSKKTINMCLLQEADSASTSKRLLPKEAENTSSIPRILPWEKSDTHAQIKGKNPMKIPEGGSILICLSNKARMKLHKSPETSTEQNQTLLLKIITTITIITTISVIGKRATYIPDTRTWRALLTPTPRVSAASLATMSGSRTN